MMIACNADKDIDPMSIYGYWESTDLGKDVANPIGLKLDFQSPEYAFIDPIADDTIYFYNYCMIENDSLVLKYNDIISKYCIKKITDSIIILKCGDKKYKYKKKYSIYRNGEEWVLPKNTNGPKVVSIDSLDVIVKSKYEIGSYGENAHFITKEEMMHARGLVLDFLNTQKYKTLEMCSDLSLNANDYVRQYIGIKGDGENYLDVYLSDRVLKNPQGYMILKESIRYSVGYTLRIDMDQNKVTDFWSNKYDI